MRDSNKVKNYIYATLETFFNKLVEIVERTEVGINIVIIFNIILYDMHFDGIIE